MPDDKDGEPSYLGDPVFQLNACLWMLQELPQESRVTPVLRRLGYVLASLSQPLPMPPATRPQLLAAKIPVGPPAPDVLARQVGTGERLVLECKRSSSGPESDSSNQLRKLLVLAADIASAVGRPGPVTAFVAVVTRQSQVPAQRETISALVTELSSAALPSGEGGCLGLSRDEDGIWVQLAAETTPHQLAALAARQLLFAADGSEEFRPLYLIPWDPSVEQEEDERAYCLGLLAERIYLAAQQQVGLATLPCTAHLKAQSLLAAATMEVSDYWRGADVATIQQRVVKLLMAGLRPVQRKKRIIRQSGTSIEVDLDSEDDRELVLDVLRKAVPAEQVPEFLVDLPATLPDEPETPN